MELFKTKKKEDNGNFKIQAISMAILAAILYGVSSPVSKILLVEIPPTLMAALLYLGAGIGMLTVNIVKTLSGKKSTEAKMTVKELPYIGGMILLDIAAPIFLMIGLTLTTSSNASLLNNFEIVATALVASFVFKEAIGKRMFMAILLITIASIILSVKDFSSFKFSAGSVFVIIGCICWGFENNFTRMLSLKDPLQIVVVKGFGSGLGSLLISIFLKEFSGNILFIIYALMLGFVAYGLSIFFYIRAQRELGAARTTTYYAAAPFIGVIISWLFLRERITGTFLIALVIMLAGLYFAISERHKHAHIHIYEKHDHKHNHTDGHHNHIHDQEVVEEHSHEHVHEAVEHKHTHLPDMHHKHLH